MKRVKCDPIGKQTSESQENGDQGKGEKRKANRQESSVVFGNERVLFFLFGARQGFVIIDTSKRSLSADGQPL